MIFKTIVFVWLLWLTWVIHGAVVLPKPYDANGEITIKRLIDVIKKHKILVEPLVEPKVKLLMPPPPLKSEYEEKSI